MSEHDNIDFILRSWEYEPYNVNARIVQGDDGRDVIQMRVDMGVLQLEMKGRPDGSHPHSHESMLDYLIQKSTEAEETYELTEDECFEVDREFVQFYHRRVCWLQLRRFEQAMQDANHTLSLMDLCQSHSSDEQWAIAHEQYRPFVLFHRIQGKPSTFWTRVTAANPPLKPSIKASRNCGSYSSHTRSKSDSRTTIWCSA